MADDDATNMSRLSDLVAEEIGAALGRRRMTNAALAAALGTSEMYVSRRMNKQTAFSLNDLDRIARVLGVSVAELLPRERVANTLRNPNPAHRPSSEPVSPDRPPRGPRRTRTRPVRTTPREDTRRPGWFPRPVPA